MTTLHEIALDLEKLGDTLTINPVSTPSRADHVEYFAQQVEADHEIYYNPEEWTLPNYKGGVAWTKTR